MTSPLCKFLEVCLFVVKEFEEVRGLSCSEASNGRIVLIRVVFAGELSIVDLDLSLGRSKS